MTLHAVFPRSVLTSFDGVNVERRPGLASILAARHDGGRAWWPWALAAGLTAAALGVTAVALRTGRLPLPRRR